MTHPQATMSEFLDKHELLHLIKAADALVNGMGKFLIIGKEPVPGRAIAVDLAVMTDSAEQETAMAKLISGTLGKGSYFDNKFCYYAHCVEKSKLTLATGWEDRAITVQFSSNSTFDEKRDLLRLSAVDEAIWKLLAGRSMQSMLDDQIVEHDELIGLLEQIDHADRSAAVAWLEESKARKPAP